MIITDAILQVNNFPGNNENFNFNAINASARNIRNAGFETYMIMIPSAGPVSSGITSTIVGSQQNVIIANSNGSNLGTLLSNLKTEVCTN